MKKFLKTLVVGLCLFTLLCCALPAVRQTGEHARAAYHDGLHL